MINEYYENIYDCRNSGDTTRSIIYDLNDNSVVAYGECHNAEPCDYFQVLCDDVTEQITIIDECTHFGQSNSFSCIGSELTVDSYSTSDCSGDVTASSTLDYSNIYNDDCHQVK